MVRRAGLIGAGMCLLLACAGKNPTSGFDQNSTGKGGASSGSSGASSGGDGPLLNDSDAGRGNGCPFSDSTDHDGDGYSGTDGDCNDCDPNVNPGAYDTGKDEDCDGTAQSDGASCDQGLTLDSTDAFDAAKAMGLCKKADANGTGKNKRWGVLNARFVKPDGSPLGDHIGHGLLTKLGNTNVPQEGARMLALSSGTARSPSDPGYQDVSGYDKGYTSGTPIGYPKESPACPGVKTGGAHDGAGVELTIRVPTNAKSFSFQENFFTYEFPGYICSRYNDFYVAMLSPKLPNLPDGNIAFDQQNNPISVNNSLLQVCVSQPAGGKNFPCPLGPSSLAGTGFDPSAATGWLQTTAPVKPGDTITLLLTIWDSGDGVLDSTVLIDKFAWSAEAATGAATTPVPTK